MPFYDYVVADTANDKVAPVALRNEVNAAGLGSVVDDDAGGIAVGIQSPTSLRIYMVGPVNEPDLAAVVAAHQGVRVSSLFHASSSVLGNEQQVVSDATWTTLWGGSTNPAFFTTNLDTSKGGGLRGTLNGGVNASQGPGGELPELRVVEDDEKGNPSSEKVLGTFAVPDSAGSWKLFSATTDKAMRPGQNTYRLEARLNGATSLSVRFLQGAFIELKVL